LARFLAIDWDHHQLHVVAAVVSGGSVRIQQAAVWPHPETPNPAEAEALGRMLRDRLRQAGIAPAPVLACVGRDRVIVKDLRFPAVPPSEEAGVVRFQAVKELTAPPDEVVIDYTRVGDGPNGERRAFAAILRRELLTAYQTLCKSAGLKLEALTPRPFGLAACLKHQIGTSVLTPPPEPADAPVAVLAVAEKWAEFCVVRGEHLLLARTLTPGPNLVGLIGEIRRNLAVYAGQQQQQVAAVYLAGASDQGELRERLQDVLGLPVHTFDPFARVERPDLPTSNRGSFAGAVGLLHARAERKDLLINFVRVKQPRVKQDPVKVRLYAGLAAAALLLIGAIVGTSLWAAQLEADVTELTAIKSQLDGQLARMEDDDKRLKALNEWHDGEIVWLDELYDLTDRFPNNTTLRLVGLTGDALTRNAKSKYVAALSLTWVSTDDHRPGEQMVSEFVKDEKNHYKVGPKQGPQRNRGAEGRVFPHEFQVRMELEHVPPAKYVRKLRQPARPDGGDDMMDFGFGFFGGQ
jgi:Tfp pilus assembly PilM family ATPase